MSRFTATVKRVLREYYYEHHDKVKMERDLTEALELEHVGGLQTILETVDARIVSLTAELEGIKKFESEYPLVIDDRESRLDELTTLKNYIKDQMLKTQSPVTLVPPPDSL